MRDSSPSPPFSQVYAVWEYRRWLLGLLVSSDAQLAPTLWQQEIQLCTLYNEKDNRNCPFNTRMSSLSLGGSLSCSRISLFVNVAVQIASVHCWNHRRWAVAKAGRSSSDEFEYTTAMVAKVGAAPPPPFPFPSSPIS